METNGPRILVVHRDQVVSQALMRSIVCELGTDEIAAMGCENAIGICSYVTEFNPDIIILNASGFEFSSVLQLLSMSSVHARILVCGLRDCGDEVLVVP